MAENEPCAVPIEEQANGLRAHYEKVSMAYGEWCNQIPVAIDLWEQEKLRSAPAPKQREEREEIVAKAARALMSALMKRGMAGLEVEVEGERWDAVDVLDYAAHLLRTHSPEEQVWHWCLQTDDWKAYPQLACSYCGSRGPNIHTLTFGGDRPNWKPVHSPEEPVGYVVLYEGSDLSTLVSCDVMTRDEAREVVWALQPESEGTYRIHPIGQPLDGEDSGD